MYGVGNFTPTRAGQRKPSLKARRIPRLANQLKRWRCAPKQTTNISAKKV